MHYQKHISRWAGSFALLAIFHSPAAQAQADTTWKSTDRGISIKDGDTWIELAPATPAALRLSVSFTAPASPAPSTFLAPDANSKRVAWKLVERDHEVGIQTAAGNLLIDPKTGQWTLEDVKSHTLIPPTPIFTFDQTNVNFPIVWAGSQPPLVYGAGNAVASLEQSNILTRVGNGVAVLPHYWSPAGYAVLAVAGNDNKPAIWHAAAGQGCGAWTFPGATADLYLMPAADLRAAAIAYDQLSGAAPVPPRWAFGYMQSRWGWKDKAYIDDTLKHFIDLNLPVDAFIFDFEWYTKHPDYWVPPAGEDNYSDFGWNPTLFPEPASQVAGLKKAGVHFVGIRKPRLGNKDSLVMMQSNDWALVKKAPNTKDGYEVRDMDFRNPGLSIWYQQQSAPLLALGVDGWWNDEGEASYTTYYFWNQSEADALALYRPGSRLWSINRAFSPGVQRLGAAVWTGDINADWGTFQRTPVSLLNWSLAGMPYGACDIGGFNHNTTPELLTRWMEAGVFFPVMRTHSTVDATPHFPWLYGTDALAAIRGALDLRYRLVPYYYSLAHETHDTGLPLMRPLMMEFPGDASVANLADQWLMGGRLMAAPVLTQTNQRSVYLPADDWYPFNTNTKLSGGQTITATASLPEIPIYVRGGSILPLGPVIQHTAELPGGPLEVQVYPGKDASFTLVEDDGQTTAYLQGQTRRIRFTWNDHSRKLTWKVEGPYKGSDVFRAITVKVFDPQAVRQASAEIGKGGQLAP